MRMLKELWYGNIEPSEYNTSSCEEYKKALCSIINSEEKLQSTFTDEQKKLFSQYTVQFVSIRLWQSASYFRIVLSWELG